MLVLGLDTATPRVTAALVEVGESSCTVLASRDVMAPNRHGELLAPLVAEVYADAGISASDLNAVAVGLGPGPFTGLRVGIVTAAATSDALGVPAYGCCSLDAVPIGAGDVVVMTDARRRQVYWARYADGHRIDGPELDHPQVLADRWRMDSTAAPMTFVGPGAELYAEALEGFRIEPGHPSAARLVECVADRVRRGAPGGPLEPLYLRRPDARPPGAPKRVVPA